MNDPKNTNPFRAALAYESKEFLSGPDGRGLRILAEYMEPLARFRRERIQDTVVFFGSARFHSHSEATASLQVLTKPGAATPAPPEEQERVKRAQTAVEMARYYEDARRLAFLLTEWSQDLPSKRHRFVVTTGGGPGIMEAANRGAREAGGKTIGLNIALPYEQMPNSYITPELNFEFHYFFMRKLWFAYLAKALVVFPGGFGTLDELFEILTLAQTEKLAKKITVLIYGEQYWRKCLNLEALADAGAIAPEDVNLFQYVDTPEQAFEKLRENLTHHHLQSPPPARRRQPEIAKTR
ncbi:MAG TPA: TIGR00730 family Rossman fold protein [Clostridia bacterium]|nr:TIGR00730 family Rossman fold protein [Clostridia bacterium]